MLSVENDRGVLKSLGWDTISIRTNPETTVTEFRKKGDSKQGRSTAFRKEKKGNVRHMQYLKRVEAKVE